MLLLALILLSLPTIHCENLEPFLRKFVKVSFEKIFPDCNLILLHDSNSFSEYLHDIATSVQTNAAINIKLNLENTDYENNLTDSRFFKETGYEGRHRENCALTLLFISKVIAEVPKFLFEFLTPLQSNIVKKDEDYFVFFSPPSVGEQLLKSKAFGVKIKFKILIDWDDKGEKPRVRTTACNFYNADSPQFKTLNFKNILSHLERGRTEKSASLKIRHLLFPDLVNFNGFRLSVSYPINNEHNIRTKLTDKGEYEPVEGRYLATLFLALKPRYNFTVRLQPTGGTGLKLKNGTWTGCVGDVLIGRAHMCNLVAHTIHRQSVIGFSFAIAFEWITFATVKPQGEFSWKAVYRPLSPFLWTCTWLSVVGVTVGMVLIFRAKPILNSSHVVESVFSALLDQSLSLPISKASVRILFGSWLLFCLVISNAYRSKLFGFIIFPEIQPAPQSFADLAHSDTYSCGLRYVGGAAYKVFASSTEQTFQKIFGKMEMIKDNDHCFNKALGVRFACISWESMLNAYCKRFGPRKSPLTAAPASTLFISAAFAFEKRAIFRTNFDKIIRLTHTSGLIQKWDDKEADYIRGKRYTLDEMIARKHTVDMKDEKGPRRLTISNLQGGYYLLGSGLIMALVVFTFEFALLRFNNRKSGLVPKVMKLWVYFTRRRSDSMEERIAMD